MNFEEMLKAPLKIKTAPFEKREGQPFLQGTSRNMGHALFGDKHATDFETRYLGDMPSGSRYPNQADYAQFFPQQGMAQGVTPQPTPQPQQPAQGQQPEWDQLLQYYMQKKTMPQQV